MRSWKDALYLNYATHTGRAGDDFSASMQPAAKKLVTRYFHGRQEARIADLGCGSGQLLQALAEGGFTRVTGVDVSEEQVRLALAQGAQNIRCQSIAAYLAEAEPHDLIAMLSILEHFDRQEIVELLTAVREALADRGELLIQVPNASGFLAQEICFGDFTHQTFFTPGSLAQLLQSIGFEIVRCDNEPLDCSRPLPMVRNILFRAAALPWCLLRKLQFGFKRRVIYTANMLVLARRC